MAWLFPSPTTLWFGETREGSSSARPIWLGASSEGAPTAIWLDPAEGRHLLVLGETGMGKSTLLVRVLVQASREAGIVLIDPIGDTVLRVLESLPPSALSKVLWIAPVSSPVGINALASLRRLGTGEATLADRGVEDLVTALRRVRIHRFDTTPFWGPRIEETLTRALSAAALFPNGSLREAAQLLTQTNGRPHGVPPAAREAVDELHGWIRDRPDQVDGARRLLGEIVRNPVLSRMLCYGGASTTVSDWVEPRRIVLISGEASQVGATAARYLVSVLLALVATELLARPSPAKTFLVLDEAQWYAHESAAEIFRLGRRANVHLCLATQSLASLPEAVSEAARTNSADLLLFRGSPEEAREFHRWNPAVTEEGLLSLPRGEALFLSGKGERTTRVAIAPWRSRSSPDLGPNAARDGSRTHWVPSDQGEDGAPPDTSTGARPPNPAPGGTLDLLLLVLQAGLAEAPQDGTVRVALRRLRDLLDPSGEAIRAAGRLLASSGSLVDSHDGPRGRQWEIRRAGFETLVSQEIDPTLSERARSLWQALSEMGGASDA